MEDDTKSSYRIKDIVFFGSPRRILLQSANGPCPLLAICNVLLLRNQISISQDNRYITFNELLEIVSGYLFDSNGAVGEASSADMAENLQACLEILPRLNDGLDVNVQFSGPTAFEFTRELAVFDLLDMNLFHGWVVSEQDSRTHAACANLSYNQVVERLIAMQDAQSRQRPTSPKSAEGEDAAEGENDKAQEGDDKIIVEGLLIQEFLDRTANQLSYDGLMMLHSTVRERQLAVFFRNSHFSALLKYEGSLYLLCTDIAFAHSHVVWERLDQVDGDTTYVDAYFKENSAGSNESAAMAAAQAAQDQIVAAQLAGDGSAIKDPDQLLALQLMQEEIASQQEQDRRIQAGSASAASQQRPSPRPSPKPSPNPSPRPSPRPPATGQQKPKDKKKDKKGCAIQ